MTFQEFVERLKFRLDGAMHSEKPAIRYISRLTAFALFAAVISTIAPTLADELASDPQMQQPITAPLESSTVTIEASASPSPTPTLSPSVTPEATISRPPVPSSSQSALPESSESASANIEGEPFALQPRYVIKVPRTAAVDPRAKSYFAPHIFATVDSPTVEFTMICVSGAAMALDALQKGLANNLTEGNERISGDQSGQVIISASTNRAINLVNSYNGLFARSLSGGIAGRTLTFRFVAVTKPVADPAFCGAAQSSATMAIRPLALDLSTVKGGGNLK